MVLKIRDADRDQKWWYYDNIAKISTDLISYQESMERCKSMGCPEVFLVNENMHPDDTVRFCIVRFKNNDECAMAFINEAYLLSDEGKTIERI